MDPAKVSIFKTYEKPRGQGGSGSFATFMIIGPTCFFLGMLFSSFPYDYPLLWTSVETPAAYYDQLETHLKFIHASPPIIPRILHIAISVGFCGFFIKLFKPSEANLLFDGASLVLYVVGVVVYITNIVKGLRIVTLNLYGVVGDEIGVEGIGREDSLRVLAASNTILALVLVGVLVLQAGQWYAERKEADEVAKFELQHEEKVAAKKEKAGNGGHVTRSASKKKQ
ncbi:secretory component protein [Phlyctema vagabunda]|uniref:Secretory component protein n=1 Tax=Phlyctema vagabunda TaxID=108571 RepID=A0ABR4P3C4_9HELO